MKNSSVAILNYLARCYPRFVSVPELQRECRQTDVRKRVSELCAADYAIEKERAGMYVNYRWTPSVQQEEMFGRMADLADAAIRRTI